MSKFLFVIIAAVLAASCTLSTGVQNEPTSPSASDIAAFQKSFMSSYYAERAGAPAGIAGGARALTPFTGQRSSGARTTVPVSASVFYPFSSVVGQTTTISHYPEPDQTTAFTATLVEGTPTYTKVYDVVATTTFPTADLRSSYVEEYYVQDVGANTTAGDINYGTTPDGTWTIDDPIVKRNATGGWSLDATYGVNGFFTGDPAARIKMLLTFADGSARTETIVSSSLSGGPKFSPVAFNITGSLDLTQAFVPAIASASENVMFSSVVMYSVSPKTNYNFWFWQGNSTQSILGIRYYTEAADTANAKYVTYTASFEKTVGALNTTGGTYASAMTTIFVGSQSPILSESVIRQKVDFTLAGQAASGSDYYRPVASQSLDRTTNMKSRVVNIAGKQDFYLSQLNADTVQLSSASSTIFVPTGDATEILATTPANLVYQKADYSIVATSGQQPLATKTVDVGLGELATLYHSIYAGADTIPIPAASAPVSNVMPGISWAFYGQQVAGSTTDPATIPALKMSGTVEAWVYISTMTDTMGIVHKGMKPDFSDEAYSLQGWGSGGQIAMIVDRYGSYDAAYSDINLNTGKWYYIVGVWDVIPAQANEKYVKLYINGVLHGSGTPTVIASLGTSDDQTIGLMVGSQLPATYNAAWGYFGVNGKIVGVNISETPMTAATALANYNAYKGSTASW